MTLKKALPTLSPLELIEVLFFADLCKINFKSTNAYIRGYGYLSQLTIDLGFKYHAYKIKLITVYTPNKNVFENSKKPEIPSDIMILTLQFNVRL